MPPSIVGWAKAGSRTGAHGDGMREVDVATESYITQAVKYIRVKGKHQEVCYVAWPWSIWNVAREKHACCLYVRLKCKYRYTTVTYTSYPQQPPYWVNEILIVQHIARDITVILSQHDQNLRPTQQKSYDQISNFKFNFPNYTGFNSNLSPVINTQPSRSNGHQLS